MKTTFFGKLKNKLFVSVGVLSNPTFSQVKNVNDIERSKRGSRTAVINKLLSCFKEPTNYLEIGVRNPNDNFYLIKSTFKTSVDAGYESKVNEATYKMTSDEFFSQLLPSKKYHVIFIDGMHTANQVNKDISNALNHLEYGGFIVLHDCNPPSEYHARESYNFKLTPALQSWNGTTWKAFVYWRKFLPSFCVDTDYGVGVIVPNGHLLANKLEDSILFYDYAELDANRTKILNLIKIQLL